MQSVASFKSVLISSSFNLSLSHISEKNQNRLHHHHQFSSIIVLIAITSGHSGRNVLVHHILWGFDFYFNHRKKPNTKPNSQPFPSFQCHDRRLVPPDPASWAQLPEETSLESFVCWTWIFFDVLRCADLICELWSIKNKLGLWHLLELCYSSFPTEIEGSCLVVSINF